MIGPNVSLDTTAPTVDVRTGELWCGPAACCPSAQAEKVIMVLGGCVLLILQDICRFELYRVR